MHRNPCWFGAFLILIASYLNTSAQEILGDREFAKKSSKEIDSELIERNKRNFDEQQRRLSPFRKSSAELISRLPKSIGFLFSWKFEFPTLKLSVQQRELAERLIEERKQCLINTAKECENYVLQPASNNLKASKEFLAKMVGREQAAEDKLTEGLLEILLPEQQEELVSLMFRRYRLSFANYDLLSGYLERETRQIQLFRNASVSLKTELDEKRKVDSGLENSGPHKMSAQVLGKFQAAENSLNVNQLRKFLSALGEVPAGRALDEFLKSCDEEKFDVYTNRYRVLAELSKK